jgi:tetratricopeptide (TPR) repeat protein
MSVCLGHWRLLPVAVIIYGCASMASPVSPLPVTESTVNEKIDQLIIQLTQETPLLADKMFAVAEFTDASDKKTALTAYLTDLLIDRLSRSGKIHLVERSRLDTVMNELDFSMTGYIEERSEKLLGRLIGADGIVTGNVIDLGDTLDVKVRLIQTETGKIIATAQVELVNDQKMQRLAGQAYEKPKTDIFDKIQGLDQLKQATELVAKGDWQGLQKLAEPWTASEPGNSLSWFHLGLAYEKLQQYDKAIYVYNEAIRFQPNNADAWYYLGIIYDKLNQRDKGVQALQEAVRLRPDDQALWLTLGVSYASLKQYDKAILAHKEYLRIQPGYNRWIIMGDRDTDERFNNAVQILREAVRLRPDDANAWSYLGVMYGVTLQHNQAVRAFQEAVRLQPGNADTLCYLGNAYYNLEQYDDALQSYRAALHIQPGHALAWFKIGVIYNLKGRRDKVREVYQTLQKFNASLADKFFNEFIRP